MKTHRLPFIAPMVRAILEGRKTQTRRAVSITRMDIDGNGSRVPYGKEWTDFDFASAWKDGDATGSDVGPYLHVPLKGGSTHRLYPKVRPGDRILGTETHQFEATLEGYDYKLETLADRPVKLEAAGCYPSDGTYQLIPRYRATEPDTELTTGEEDEDGYLKKCGWLPPMFMPAWASRLPLIVTRVRIERIQSISDEDCIREGIRTEPYVDGPKKGGWGWTAGDGYPRLHTPRQAFKHLIDSINSPEFWERNDWVLVYEFDYKPEPGRVIPAEFTNTDE